jgi:hypothetical protein
MRTLPFAERADFTGICESLVRIGSELPKWDEWDPWDEWVWRDYP